MTGENFGYTPPHRGPYAQYDDYIKPGTLDNAIDEFGDTQDPIVEDGEETPNPADVDNAMMDKLWLIVAKESDELTASTARLWRDISSLLEHTRMNVKAHAEALAEKWKSPAAESFLLHVGAGLYSLEEWKKAADENASALSAISGQVATTQTEVKKIWDDYKVREASEKADRESKGLGDLVDGNWADDYDEVSREFANKARPYVQDLATAYTEAIYYKLGRGTKYKGPTDAAVKMPTPPARPGMPAGVTRPSAPPVPRGDRPAAPQRPEMPQQPERPALPDRPERPDLPNRPDVPTGVELAGTVTHPAPPPPPQVAPGVPSGGPGGPPPASPVLPSTGVPGRPGNPGLRANNPMNRPGTPQVPGAPSAPGRGGGGQRPGSPQLPGRGGQNARSAAPKRPGAPTAPQLPGRGGQGARPTAPGRGRAGAPGTQGGPAAPKLPGRGAKPGTQPGSPRQPGGMPTNPATPPKLAGRGGTPAKPTSAPKPTIGGDRPGVAGVPDTHGAPTNAATSAPRSAPGLGGRRQQPAGAANSEPPGTRPGVNPALGGRAGAAPAEHDVRNGAYGAPQRRQTRPDDEDLWAVEESAPPVIDRPVDERPDRPEPGPALGAGR